MEQFYPDIKPHISPSALANWYDAKGTFVRSYFMGQKSPETSSMRAGKKIHAMAEGGLLDVQHRFEHHEKTLTVELPVEGAVYKVLGIPDSFGMSSGIASFVDYKSGKENTWDKNRLASDLKMKTTAWLVWQETGKPMKVIGYIEYIPTQWNPITKEVEPTGEASIQAGEIIYDAADLEAFTGVILNTIVDINVGYQEWLESTDEFINQDDVAAYAQLDQEVREREAQMDEIIERIADQMKLGGKETIQTPFGSFYFTSTKKYDIPKDLMVEVEETDIKIPLAQAELITAASSAAITKFKTENQPVSVTKSVTFRAKKNKK